MCGRAAGGGGPEFGTGGIAGEIGSGFAGVLQATGEAVGCAQRMESAGAPGRRVMCSSTPRNPLNSLRPGVAITENL